MTKRIARLLLPLLTGFALLLASQSQAVAGPPDEPIVIILGGE